MANPRIVAEEDAFLIDILSLLHPEAKRNSLRRMIDHGRVTVDGGEASRAKQEVPAGSTVETLSRTEVEGPSRKAVVPEPDVLYDDKHLMVVNKPAGLLSVATPRGEPDTMFDRARRWVSKTQSKRVHLVHRLDRETSGCLILAKSSEVRDILQSQFKDRSVERIYHAVVFGSPPSLSGISTSRVKETRDKRVRLVQKGERGGKEAITKWEVEEKGPIHTLVRIKIDTGRRAQIRLHMSELGCPVSGDTRYGRGRASVNRLCLHATSLGFDHPYGDRVRVSSDLPPKLMSELRRRSL